MDQFERKDHLKSWGDEESLVREIFYTKDVKHTGDAIRLRIPLEEEGNETKEEDETGGSFDLFSHTNLFFETRGNVVIYHSELPRQTKEVFGVGNRLKRKLDCVTPTRTNDNGTRINVSDDGYTGLYNLQFDLDKLDEDDLEDTAPPDGPITDLTQVRLCTWPRKLNTDQANRIISDMFDRHFEHVLQTDHASGQAPLSIGARDELDPLQQMLLLEHLWEDVRDDYEEVAWRPHRRLVTEHPQKNVMDVQDPAYDKITDLLQDPNAVMLRQEQSSEEPPGGHVQLSDDTSLTFRQMVDRKSRIDYDTYPNQFVKQMLRIVRSICRHAIQEIDRRRAGDADEGADEISSDLRDAAERIRREVDRWREKPFWEEVSDLNTRINTNNHTLMKDDRYSQILDFYMDLMSDIQLADDDMKEMMTNPLHHMHQVYEYWCWFKIGDLIGSMEDWDEQSPSSVNLTDNGGFVRMFGNGDRTIDVHYQLTATTANQTDQSQPYRSWSKSYQPDISVIIKKDGSVENVLIFDAKYKATLSEEEDGADGWKGEDIDKMHGYRDAIRLSDDNEEQPLEQPLWFLALYPGDKIRFYSPSFDGPEWNETRLNNVDSLQDFIDPNDEDALNDLISEGGVGAFPLLPTME
jgi:predicted component of viral defense system (DUF524 family)